MRVDCYVTGVRDRVHNRSRVQLWFEVFGFTGRDQDSCSRLGLVLFRVWGSGSAVYLEFSFRS